MQCRKDYICNTESRSCVKEKDIVKSNANCPNGREKISLYEGNYMRGFICRKMCPKNWREIKNPCGVHQYCKEEIVDDRVTKENKTTRFYCETPRCDAQGQVS